MLAATALFAALALAVFLTTGRVGSVTVETGTQTVQTVQAAERLDINTAPAEALERLPEIGPALAERIVADREANGPFAAVEELRRVDGIGEKTVEAIAPYVTAGGAAAEKGER